MALLKTDQQILSEKKKTYTVGKMIGAGAQGEVYKVKDEADGEFALKIYYADKLRQLNGYDRQYAIIKELVYARRPDARLAWPMDLIEENGTFGYVMELVPEGFVSVRKFLTNSKYYLSATFTSRIRFCYYLSEVFQKLHLMGYSYCDVSDNNILIKPETGEIAVIDNDNVVVNGEKGNILGTPEFIAPEIFKPDAIPNRQTDLYSLSVLLFKLLYLSHPLLGKREPPLISKEDEYDLFIRKPLFIYDPDDESNRPDPQFHRNAILYWEIYPRFLNDMFVRAFTAGLKEPNKRIFEAEWKTALYTLENSQVTCCHESKGEMCGAGNFCDRNRMTNPCWSCGKSLSVVWLQIRGNVTSEIALNIDPPTVITEHHVYNNDNLSVPVGELVRNPKNPAMIGLKNVSDKSWTVIKPNGASVVIQSGEAYPIVEGAQIVFDEKRKITGEIIK